MAEAFRQARGESNEQGDASTTKVAAGPPTVYVVEKNVKLQEVFPREAARGRLQGPGVDRRRPRPGALPEPAVPRPDHRRRLVGRRQRPGGR
jgi:hypothetical protein